MKNRSIPAAFCAVLLLATGGNVWGQGFSSGSGMFGGQQLGTNTAFPSNSAFGSSGFNTTRGTGFSGGQSGLGQSGFGQSGFGQSGFGQSGFGQSGFGQGGQSGFGQSGFGQSGYGQSSFGQVGGTGGFVGADSSTVRNVRSAAGGGQSGFGQGGVGQGGFGQSGFGQTGLGQGGFGQTGGYGGQQFGGGQGGFNNAGAGAANQAIQIRTRIELGFQPVRPPAAQTSVAIAGRLNNISQIQSRVPFEVAVDGRTIVLRGSVATQHQRDLAERVASLEPGVSAIRNEIVVSGSGAGGEVIPTPAQ